jgi:hypothetical protein
VAFACALLLLACACTSGGGRPPAATPRTIAPASASLVVKGTLQYTATGATGTVTWSVDPPEGGTFDAKGLFTASSVLGKYTITATWPTGLTATTTLDLIAAPVGGLGSLNLIEANGGDQRNAAGTLENTTIIGESVGATSTNANGTLQNRTGILPPVPAQ